MPSLSSSGKVSLDNAIREAVASGRVPGFVAGATNVDGDIYLQAAGKKVVNDPNSDDVDTESVFWICSQTKLVVSLAALKLIEQGKITFDTAVADYLPVFGNPIILDDSSNSKAGHRPASTVVTVKHLMTHSSGLFYPDPKDRLAMDEAYTDKGIHEAEDPISSFFQMIIGDLPGLPLKFEPGTDFAYGWSTDALGFIVEKVSGKSLEAFCKAHFFEPLQMNSTSFYLTPDLEARLVNLAHRTENGELEAWANQAALPERDPKKVRIHFGGDGLYTSMTDYLKLLRRILQLNTHKNPSNSILTHETLSTIFAPSLSEQGAKTISQYVMTEGAQFSTALAITGVDRPNRRKKGSVWWGGWANTSHFIDPVTGVAFFSGTQLCPPGDMEATKLMVGLEGLLYSNLEN